MSAASATSFGVRQVASHQRHPLILNRFATPQPGESMQLINRHDPEPLYDQRQTRSGDSFNWAHLEVVPKGWHVQIGKTAGLTSDCGSGSTCGG